MSTIRTKVSVSNPYYLNNYRYLELKNFCLQYFDWKSSLSGLSGYVSAPTEEIRSVGTYGDRTANVAMRRRILSKRIEMVEQMAIKTDPDIYRWILDSVTLGISYDALNARIPMPCGRSYFYKRYRKFFWLLDKVRE